MARNKNNISTVEQLRTEPTLIGWARVSTFDQSLDAQVSALKTMGCKTIYQHKHSGKGKSDNKDALDTMIYNLIQDDVVVCTKLDRLGRSAREVLNAIDAIFDKGATFKTLDGAIDTTSNNPMARATITIAAAFAELERDLISNRLNEGKLASGNYGGRPAKLDKKAKEAIRYKANLGVPVAKLAREHAVSGMTIRRALNESPKFNLEPQLDGLLAKVNDRNKHNSFLSERKGDELL